MPPYCDKHQMHYEKVGDKYLCQGCIKRPIETMGSSEILDLVFDEDGGFEAFVEMAKTVLKAKIEFDKEECHFEVTFKN